MILRVGAVLAAALAFAGLAAAAQAPTKRAGTLTVGLNLPAPAFAVGAVKGDEVVFARGFEVDLARALKARLKLARVSFINIPNRSRFLASGSKRFDIGLARTIVRGRDRRVDFSGAVLTADLAVVLSEGTPRIKTLSELRALTICAVKGGIGPVAVRSQVRPAVPLVGVKGDDALLDALEEGRCDAAVREAPLLAAALVARGADAFGPVVGRIHTGAVMVATLERRSPLTPQVDAALARLRRDGTIGRLARRWLAFDPASLPRLR